MLIARHGGSSHYVRPDAVYKTGVLQSIVGYEPHQDVMGVAQGFTQGPYAFQQGNVDFATPTQSIAPSAVITSMVAQPGVSGFGNVQLLGRPPITFLGAFGATSNIGFFQKLRLRFNAWRATKQARAFMAAGMHGLGGLTPYGPQAWAGGRVVPGAAQRMGLLVAMQQANQPQEFAQLNSDALMQRWNILRAPTR
jgi:hypothetical protein